MRGLKNLLDKLTLAIVKDRRGPQQIRSALLSAAKVRAVAAAAIGVIDRAPARDERRVRRIPLLRGKARHTAASLRKSGDRPERYTGNDKSFSHVHQASTGGSVNIARESTSTAAFKPSSIDASASSCSMLIT